MTTQDLETQIKSTQRQIVAFDTAVVAHDSAERPDDCDQRLWKRTRDGMVSLIECLLTKLDKLERQG